jgi:2-methylcitrate dehydratase PrpD
VLDNFGVALAASGMPIGQKILDHVAGLGGTAQAGVIGRSWRTSAPLAALANGTLSSSVDLDAGLHLTTHVLPAAMAVGELVKASGKQVLEAFAAGYEIGARLSEAIDPDRQRGVGMSLRGWYHVGFVSPIVSALTAGKLLGLSIDQLRGAMGLAAATSGGLRRNFGTMAKAYQAGHGASQGVHAALLAADGFDGDPDILEAPLGLLGALEAEESDRILGQLGSQWELLASLRIKRYAACTPAHQPVAIALRLQREHGFAADDVEAIEADLHDTYSLIRLDPRDEIAGGFSLPFLLAVSLIDGELGLDQVRDERIHDPRVRGLMARVGRVAAPTEPESLTIRLRDGRTFSGEAGRPPRLESAAEVQAKFEATATRVLTASRAQRLIEAVGRLETLTSVGELVALAVGA